MATIRDVARLAGVSISTVSAVINNRSGTSAAVRRRVLEAIATVDYRPNGLARSLRTHRTHAIGLLVSDITNPFFADLARGIEDEAHRQGFYVILCNTDDESSREEAQIRLLLEKQVDGIIATAVRTDSRIGSLTRNTPLVLVNRRIPGLNVDFIGIDNIAASREVVQHLVALGHRRIAFISGAELSTASDDRYLGYCQGLASAGLTAPPELVVRGHLKYEGGYQATKRLLSQCPPPTAIFAGDDMMALGAIRALAEVGLRAGEDIAVVGFDDIWIAAQPGILLSTVSQPRHEMGVTAVRLLAERLQSGRKRPRTVILPHRLVIRRTCGARGALQGDSTFPGSDTGSGREEGR